MSEISNVVSAVNRDQNLDHRASRDSGGAQPGSTPTGLAVRTVEAPAKSVDAAEHRFTIHVRWRVIGGNQEETCHVRSAKHHGRHFS
jgi:hypothetical protein